MSSATSPADSKSGFPWTSALGVLLLLAALGVSMARVLRVQRELDDPAVTTIRLSHWQLELGYRDALQKVINEYEKIQLEKHGRRVRVVQMPVTEKVYGQWLNTHLISGTAPDLVEMGFSRLISSTEYMVRFFLPLTDAIDEPNPYNAGTGLQNTPWRETFLDGMRSGYRPELQDYFSVPTSFFGVRIYYNKDMFEKASGSDEPPQTYASLLEICAKLRELRGPARRPIVPMAGGMTNVSIILDRYSVPFYAQFEPVLDVNLDGTVDGVETYMGFLDGKVGMQNEVVRQYFAFVKQICEQFSEGFMATDRQQASFMFVQGNAGMIVTGSWDARSLQRQAQFRLGVFDFPLPAKDEPFGQYILGRMNEASAAGGANYGVYKYSKNRELAIDFLRFLTSQEYNGIFNKAAEWPPIVIGSPPSEFMRAFLPDPRGYNAKLVWDWGSFLQARYRGKLWQFLQGEIPYEAFAKEFEEALRNPTYGGDIQWAREYRALQDRTRNDERVMAVHATRAMFDPSAIDAEAKHQQALVAQVRSNKGNVQAWRFEQIRSQEIPKL